MKNPTCHFLVAASACIAAVIVGCRAVAPRQDADDFNWDRFVEVAGRTTVDTYSTANGGQKYFAALEFMALTNRCWIHGPILVASGDRTHVSVDPIPSVCGAQSQVLLASGDVSGDGQPEFIFAAGWWGPMAGVLAVYDQRLRQLAQIDTGCIWSVQVVRDGPGRACIMCHEDEHPGSGLFLRYTRVYRFTAGVGLVRERDKEDTANQSRQPTPGSCLG